MTLLLSFTLFADDSKVHYLFTEEKLSENQISQKIKVLYSPFLQIRSIEINPRLSSEQGVKKGDKVIINLADDKEYHATITKTSKAKDGPFAIRAKVDNAIFSRFILTTNKGQSIGIFEIIDDDFKLYFINTAPADGNTYIIQYDPHEDNQSISLPDISRYQDYDIKIPSESIESSLINKEESGGSSKDELYQLTVNIDPPDSGKIIIEGNEYNFYQNNYAAGTSIEVLFSPERISEYAGGYENILSNEYNFFNKWTRDDGDEITGYFPFEPVMLEAKKQRKYEFNMPANDLTLTANLIIPYLSIAPYDLDLMILYTSAAKEYIETLFGGEIDNFMEFVMQYLNESFLESEIDLNINLVRHRLVCYDETMDFHGDSIHLYTPGDGHLDSILEERNLIGADLVSLFVRHPQKKDSYYVLGKGMGLKQGLIYSSHSSSSRWWDETPETCFCNVVSLDHPFQSNPHNYLLTFTHEIGHNLGAGHHLEEHKPSKPGPQMYDRYDKPEYCGYSKAYNFILPANGQYYRTIMASTADYNGTHHTRIGMFSNPQAALGDPMYGGAYVGGRYPDYTSNQDNARTIQFAAHHVANYRERISTDDIYIILEKSHQNPLGGTVTINDQVYEHGDVIGPFVSGNEISISVEPNEEPDFFKWIVGGDAQIHNPLSENTTITMENEPIVLLAHFGYQVATSAYEDRGIVDGGGYYHPGETVLITASAPEKSDYVFKRWHDNNSADPYESDLPIDIYSPVITFEMPNYNISLMAIFSGSDTDVYPLNTWVDPYFAGEISINSSDTYLFEPGEMITLSVAAYSDDFCFMNWSSEDAVIEFPYDQEITIQMPDSDADIYANYGYMATLAVQPENSGNITIDPVDLCFSAGDTYDINAVANEGYVFSYWSTSVYAQIDDFYNLQTSITMPDYYMTLTAHFSETYNLALDSDPESIGAVFTGAGDYVEGESVSISVSDIEGYEFIGWTGDDIGLLENSSGQSTSFIMPDRDVVFTALFEEILDKAVVSFKQPSEMKGIWIWSYNEGRSGNNSKGSDWMNILSGASSLKMQAGDITNNGDLEIVANLEGNGLWYYSIIHNSWHLIISINPNEFTISKTPDGYQVIASFTDYGIYRILIDESRSTMNRILTIPGQRIVSANIDRDAEAVDELIISFAGYGLYIYDYYEDKFSRILSVWPSVMSADDITGDTFDELVCCFDGYGVYLGTFNGEGRDIMAFEEKYTFHDISHLTEDKPSGKGLNWMKILSVNPDGPMQTGNIANDAGSEIIISYSQLVYTYSYGLGWSQIPSIPYFEQIISGNFTDSINEDLIIYDNELNNLYLWRSDSKLLELLWENSGEGEITAVSTLN